MNRYLKTENSRAEAAASVGALARILSAAIALLCICTLFVCAGALSGINAEKYTESGGVTVIKAPDPDILSSKAGYIIDNFESRALSWYTSGGAAPEYISVLGEYPYLSFEGDSCVNLKLSKPDEWNYIEYNYYYETDLSAYKELGYVLFCPEIQGAAYQTMLTLISPYGNYSLTADIESGDFCAAVFDISGFQYLRSVTMLKIEVRSTADTAVYASDGETASEIASGAVSATDEISVQLDLITASSDRMSRYARFMSEETYLYGGNISTNDKGNTVLDINATSPFFELYSLGSDTFGKYANSVTMKLINRTDASSVTMYYTLENDLEYVDERNFTVDVTQSEEIQYLTFPIDPENLKEIRFTFSGRVNGSIEIISILPSCRYEGPDDSLGRITNCVYSGSGTEITVSGVLTENACNLFRNYKLQLYAIPYNRSFSDIAAADIQSVAQTTVASEFRFHLSEEDVISEYLYKKFAIGISYNNRILFIDSDKYITNPEALLGISATAQEAGFTHSENPKGTVEPETVFPDAYNTVIELKLEKLYTQSDSVYHYQPSEPDFKRINFATDYVLELDSIIKEYSAENIRVNLLVTLSKSENETANRLLIHPDALEFESDGYYAFNTRSEEALIWLRAACEFVAGRYGGNGEGTHGIVSNIIYGFEINEKSNYFMGEKSIGEFTESYSAALRTVCNAVKSKSQCQVYISVGSTFDFGYPAGSRFAFDGKNLLQLISDRFAHEGKAEWNISANPYPENSGYIPVSEDTRGDENEFITFKSIDKLVSFISGLSGTPSSGSRSEKSLILLEFAHTDGKKDIQTANYIYSFYRMSQRDCSSVEAFIINHYVDPEIFTYIDTNKSETVCEKYRAVFGEFSWTEILGSNAFDISRAVKRSVEHSAFSPAPENIIGSVTLWDFKDIETNSGWKASQNCKSIASDMTMFDRSGLLAANLLSKSGGEYCGIAQTFSVPIDCTPISYIKISLHTAGMPVGTENAEFAVLLFSEESYAVYNGSVGTDGWNDIILDLNGFSKSSGIDKMKIFLKTPDGEAYGDPVMVIDEISGLSERHNSDYLAKIFNVSHGQVITEEESGINMPVVFGLVLTIIIALSVWIFSIISRMKDVDKN